MSNEPTIQAGMVVFTEKTSTRINLEEVKTPLDMLKYFEFYGMLSWVTGRGPEMLLNACPICNGLDPDDSKSALPELRDLYKKSAGHKPGCKLAEMLGQLKTLTMATPEGRGEDKLKTCSGTLHSI